MKKNNRGFTLVEILASIVILGILAVFALPMIINTIENSRNRMYVSDAKKLIARAEYKLKANSSQIERPDPGSAIVISLIYLDGPDFDNPPNNGEYVKDSSFVVVKNNSGTMEYSASIVEKMKKGGYKGVILSTDEVLSTKSAVKRVKIFQKDELAHLSDIDENDLSSTKSFINNSLGNSYVDSVEKVYNYPDITDESFVDAESAPPKILSVTMSSASGKEYGSLDAILRVQAEDPDTAKKELSVVYSFTDYNAEDSVIENYGDNNVYSKDFDFSTNHSYNGEVITLYVVVMDKEGNESRKSVEYILHNNEGPEFKKGADDYYVRKRSVDNQNMVKAAVKMTVQDDITATNDLDVCFVDYVRNNDSEANQQLYNSLSCTNFKKYSEYFHGGEEFEYEFKNCPGGCKQDGTVVGLKAVVKDSHGQVVDFDLSGSGYVIYKNLPPKFGQNNDTSGVTIISNNESFLSGGKKSLNTTVHIDVIDDLSVQDSDIKVTLAELNSTTNEVITTNTKTVDYNRFVNIPFSFTGKYDGKDRKLRVTLKDTYGGINSIDVVYTNVYKNKPPTVTSISYENKELICDKQSLCPDERGGHYDTLVNLKISDDLDDASTLKVCLSEDSDPSKCTNYKNYSTTFLNKKVNYVFSHNNNAPFNGETKKLYIHMKDSYDAVGTDSNNYKLYQNDLPIISNYKVESKPKSEVISEGSLNVHISFDVIDDLTSAADLKCEVAVDGTPIGSGPVSCATLASGFDAKVSNIYDGTTKNIKLTVTEEAYSAIRTDTKSYTLYMNKSPKINNYEVTSNSNACSNAVACPLSYGGSTKVKVELSITDDIDSDNNLTVCVSQNQAECDPTNPDNNSRFKKYKTNFVDSVYTYNITPINTTDPYGGYNNKNETHKIYVVVKDKHLGSATKSLNYKLYMDRAPFIDDTDDDNDKTYAVSQSGLEGADKIYLKSLVTDDFTSKANLKMRICYKQVTEDEEEEENPDLSTYTCQSTDYVKYNDSAPIDFNVSSYDNQLYNILLYVKDEKGKVSMTSTPYMLATDLQPALYASAAYNIDGTLSGYSHRFSFVDPFSDTYNVCFSRNNTSCDNYTTANYSSSDGVVHVEYYNKTFSDTPNQVYVFAKNNNGIVKVEQAELVKNYTLCSTMDEADETIKVSDTIKSGQPTLSMSRCEGLCYGWRNGSNTKHLTNSLGESLETEYTRKYTFNDYYKPSKECTKEVDYKAYCDYVTCFKKQKDGSTTYVNNVIGTAEREGTVTLTIAGHTYTDTKYYQVYISKRDASSNSIIFNTANEKIPVSAINNNAFKYDSSNVDSYIRAWDGPIPS